MTKFSTSIVIGNATTDNSIHFRKKSFLTESNYSHIENCILTFNALPFSWALQNLVKMTCCPKENIPEELWQTINLDPNLIPENTWNSFVNELRYQYKITHPEFMTEFDVPVECSSEYNTLVSHTSEVAAYIFYKKASGFLYDHIPSVIGQDHISDTMNLLNWHSRDPEANRNRQIRGLRRLSLRDYEAVYFFEHLEHCTALLQSMLDYMNMEEQPSVMEPAKAVANDDDLPYFFGDPTPAATQSTEKAYLELSFENILKFETDFLGFVLNNDDTCYNRLHEAGFDMDRVRTKIIAIYRALYAHNEMAKAIEDLNK